MFRIKGRRERITQRCLRTGLPINYVIRMVEGDEIGDVFGKTYIMSVLNKHESDQESSFLAH